MRSEGGTRGRAIVPAGAPVPHPPHLGWRSCMQPACTRPHVPARSSWLQARSRGGLLPCAGTADIASRQQEGRAGATTPSLQRGTPSAVAAARSTDAAAAAATDLGSGVRSPILGIVQGCAGGGAAAPRSTQRAVGPSGRGVGEAYGRPAGGSVHVLRVADGGAAAAAAAPATEHAGAIAGGHGGAARREHAGGARRFSEDGGIAPTTGCLAAGAPREVARAFLHAVRPHSVGPVPVSPYRACGLVCKASR